MTSERNRCPLCGSMFHSSRQCMGAIPMRPGEERRGTFAGATLFHAIGRQVKNARTRLKERT